MVTPTALPLFFLSDKASNKFLFFRFSHFFVYASRPNGNESLPLQIQQKYA
jgi:hypothetical protein